MNDPQHIQLLDHQQRVQGLLHLIKPYTTLLESLKLETERKQVITLEQSLRSDEFRILVIGEFNRGKSTLINAMLGRRVLPAFPVEATAIINEIRWGTSERALLHYTENGKNKQIDIPVKELERYVVVKDSKENPYDMVEIFWPLELLEAKVLIVDSPGLNVVNAGRKAMTMNYLPQADAIIFVAFCQAAGEESEIRTIERIRNAGNTYLFFVCNRINQVDPDEREIVRQDCRKKFGPLTDAGDKYVFFVNALGALKAREAMTGEKNQVTIDGQTLSPDQALKGSGISEVEAALTDFLVHERGRIKLLRPAHALQYSVRSTQNALNEQEALLHMQGEQLAARYKQAEGSLKHIELLREKIGLQIKDFGEDLSRLAKKASRDFYRGIPEKIDSWVASYDVQVSVGMDVFFSEESRSLIAQSVASELSEVMAGHIQTAFREWEKVTLQPLLVSAGEKLFPQVIAELKEFAQEFQEVRQELLTGASDPHPVDALKLDEFVQGVLERASISSGTVDLNEFGFGSLLKDLLPTGGILGSLVLALGWNPLILAIGLGIAAVLVITGKTDKIKQKLKDDFCREYKTKLTQEAGDLADQVGEAIRQHFQEFYSRIDAVLHDEVQKFREQVESAINDIEMQMVQKRLEEIKEARVDLAKFDGELTGIIGELKLMKANI